MNKIKVAVDAMGGDFAPLNDVSGAIIAAEEKKDSLEIILVGKETRTIKPPQTDVHTET